MLLRKTYVFVLHACLICVCLLQNKGSSLSLSKLPAASCCNTNGTMGNHMRIVNELCRIQDARQCCNSPCVCLQGQSDHSKGKFEQPPQLVWLAMNVLLTLIKPKAMVALLEQVWPGLVDALLQESERPSQHMWMVMGCLRTIVQVLGVQVLL